MILLALVAALGLAFSIMDWRRGLLLCLAIGFLQDPLRKITPGRPVAFVVLVGVFFGGAALGFLVREGFAGVRSFFAWYPGLRTPILAFVAVVCLQSGVTVVTTGSPILAAIGLISYLSPLVALFLGVRFGASEGNIGRWQKVYVAGALAVGVSIFLAFVGYTSRLFDSIGETTVFGRGGPLVMVSGLLRSSETAAWHCATAACLVVIWTIARRHSRVFWLGSAVTLGLVLAVVLTGRRKTLGEVLLFLVVFGFLLIRARMGATRLLRFGGGLGFAAVAAFMVLAASEQESNVWNPYLARSASLFADAPERLSLMVLGGVVNVVRENGFLGRGAGTGAQGAQYFGGGVSLVGWSAEGGLGRVTAELGVPGLIVVLWLSLAVFRRLWHIARALPRAAPEHTIRFSGLFALIPANAVVFLTAHQVFGDPFVLIVLGLIASSALAIPQIVASERQLAQQESRPAERTVPRREVARR